MTLSTKVHENACLTQGTSSFRALRARKLDFCCSRVHFYGLLWIRSSEKWFCFKKVKFCFLENRFVVTKKLFLFQLWRVLSFSSQLVETTATICVRGYICLQLCFRDLNRSVEQLARHKTGIVNFQVYRLMFMLPLTHANWKIDLAS